MTTIRIKLAVVVEVERNEGKFASKDELAELIGDEMSGLLDGTDLYCEAGGTYEVVSTEVEGSIA